MEFSSFFNSVGGDRKYKAEDWAEYFGSFIGNGVFPVPSSGLQCVAQTGMTVKIQAGKAWINGYFYYNTSDLLVTLKTADGVLQRIDRIVIRWDLSERKITAAVKSSTPSAVPAAPELQRDADAYEIAIADVLVGAGATAIEQSNITDRRYSSNLCGIVTGLIDQLDFSSYSEQLEAQRAEMESEFETWFENVQNALSGDVAGNLLNQINQKAAKTIERTATLTAAGWTGDEAPYTQAVTISGLAADAHLIVGLAPSATAEQVEAAASAMLLATAQAAGSITLSAYGDKPEAAIPILIMEVG